MDKMDYEDPVKRSGDGTPIIVVVAFILMLSIPYIYTKIDKYFLSEEAKQTAIKERQREEYARKTEPEETAVRETPQEQISETIKERQLQPSNAVVYDISITDDGFEPIDMKGPAASLPLGVQFYPEEFINVRKPDFTGHQQWYGVMELGNQLDRQFHLVLDLQDDNTFRLFFDKNNNEDLTDDGKPLINTGSGSGGPEGFACRISIPWQVLIKNSPFDGDFNIWFFLKKAGWEFGNQASHYSFTQLQKVMSIGDKNYTVLLIDRGNNDADLSNDGVAIDLNRDGKIDREERSAVTHKIDGLSYEFDVHW